MLFWYHEILQVWSASIYSPDIFAVIGRDLYGTVDPGRYGNLAKAVFTLFQLITLDDWFQMYTDINPGIYWPVAGLQIESDELI